MKIILRVGAAEYILANGPERGAGLHAGPSGLSHNSDVIAQVTPRLNASFAKPRLKSNLQTRMAFTVCAVLSDEQDAVNYAAFYPASIPRAGELRLLSRREEVETVMRVKDCVITSISPQQNGVSVTINYSITGGEVILL